jgi:hypothetical protein
MTFLHWVLEPASMPLDDVECMLDSGDLVVVPDSVNADLVVRTRESGTLVWDGAADTLAPLDEYAATHQTRVLYVRLLLVSSDRRRLLRRALEQLLRRQWSAAPRVAVEAVQAAGGTWAVPRSSDYSEQDIALMRMASPAYALIDAYIRLGLAEACKSANLYDWHDLVAGDLDGSLADGCRLTKPVVVFRCRRHHHHHDG